MEFKLDNKAYKVIHIRILSENTYVIKLTKNNFQFEAGQYLVMNVRGDHQKREYSIYSSPEDDFLEVLIREVEDGHVSKRLKHLNVGDYVEIEGPYGRFNLSEPSKSKNQKVMFIASGTGLSPCHSIVKSFPDIDYSVLHGVRYSHEAYDKEHYKKDKYLLCTSRDDKGDFNGRVTEYLMQNPVDLGTEFYLCGNSQMVFEVQDILKEQGINRKQIHTEVYF